MPKSVTIADTGETVQFPDTVGEDEMLQSISQFRQQNQQAQNFQNQHPLAQGLQQLVGPQFGFQPPTQNEFKIPVVPGNTFGMKPETLNNTLGIIQNTQNSNAAERIRQRVQMEQEMEREKDRSQQLKLEQQRMKNEMMMEKMREQREAAKLKAEGEKGSIYNTTDGPIWAGMGPSGPTARAIPVEGRAGATGKFKPLPGGAETALINGKLTTAYTLYNEETGETKFIELGATPADNVELQLIETVDEAGRPSRRFVRKEEGASYPMPPKPESRAGQLAPRDMINLAKQSAQTRFMAQVQTDPDLVYQGDDGKLYATTKGADLMRRLESEEYNILSTQQGGGGGGAGNQPTVGGSMPTTIDRDTGIVITD